MEINFDKTHPEHYLKNANATGSIYYDEFIEALNILKPHLTEKQLNDLLVNKLLLKQNKFDKNKFIQYAVEMSVLRYFAEEFGNSFKYENKVNPNNNTDVDCSITDKGFKFNIEVKTPILDKKDQDISPGLKGRSLGRLPDGQFDAIPKAFDELLNIQEGTTQIFNFDNKLKQFLIDSNKKFDPENFNSENEANILLLGLDDTDEIMIWINYLRNEGNSGLFTFNSFCNPEEYKCIDFVVFTNLYFKHKNAISGKCVDHWNLKNSFAIMYNNPMGNPKKKGVLEHFLNLCPNYNIEIGEYEIQRDDLDQINGLFKLKYFVEDELEKNREIYLFEKQAGNNT